MTQKEFELLLANNIKEALEEQRVEITNEIATEIDTKIKLFYLKEKPTRKLSEEGLNDDPAMNFKTWGEQLQMVRKAATGVIDPRLVKTVSGLGENDDAAGNFLVQADFATELIRNTHNGSTLAKKCRKIPISSNANSLIINGLDEKSRKNGSRYGGIQVYWTDEAATVTATKPSFRQIELKLKKLTGAYYATDELLDDTTALQSECASAFSEEFAFKVDDAILDGGGGGRPLGILKSGALIQIAKETGQAADTILAENIMKMPMRCSVGSRPKAEWYYNIDCEPQLAKMTLVVGTGGIPVYLPAGGLSQAPYGALYGRPMTPLEQCSGLGDVGDIIYGDFSKYLLIEKSGIAASQSVHVRFLYNEQIFKFVYRLDGQPLNNGPLAPYKGTTTTSPFVAIAARA